MRYLLPLSAVLLLTAMIGGPKSPSVVVGVSAASTDLWVRYTVNADGVGGYPDSMIVTTGLPSVSPVERSYTGVTVVDSVLFAGWRPAVNGTISGTIAAKSWRRGLPSPSQTITWSYTEPDVAPGAPTVQATVRAGE